MTCFTVGGSLSLRLVSEPSRATGLPFDGGTSAHADRPRIKTRMTCLSLTRTTTPPLRYHDGQRVFELVGAEWQRQHDPPLRRLGAAVLSIGVVRQHRPR